MAGLVFKKGARVLCVSLSLLFLQRSPSASPSPDPSEWQTYGALLTRHKFPYPSQASPSLLPSQGAAMADEDESTEALGTVFVSDLLAAEPCFRKTTSASLISPLLHQGMGRPR